MPIVLLFTFIGVVLGTGLSLIQAASDNFGNHSPASPVTKFEVQFHTIEIDKDGARAWSTRQETQDDAQLPRIEQFTCLDRNKDDGLTTKKVRPLVRPRLFI